MASREVERKRQVNQALRAVRRTYRSADSKGEKLERILDRLIARKTRPTADELIPLATQYNEYAGAIRVLEKAIIDVATIAAE